MKQLTEKQTLELLDKAKGPFILKKDHDYVGGMQAALDRVYVGETYILTLWTTATKGGAFRN